MAKCLAVCALLGSRDAAAQLQQPAGGGAIPRPPSVGEINLVTQAYGWSSSTQSPKDADGTLLPAPILYGDYYSPPEFPQFEDGDAITLQGLFKWRGEAIDPLLDARADAGALVPHCGLEVEVVLGGGHCQQLRLGWYNAPTDDGAPEPSEVYDLVPESLATWLDCKTENGVPRTDGFCPLAWDNRSPRDLSLEVWRREIVPLDLFSDVRYRGGAIGLVLQRGSSSSSFCTEATYSVLEHNTLSLSGEPYVGAVTYESKAVPGTVYVAFEDGLMLPGDWTNSGQTDGDFNDYVVQVSGCFEGSVDPGTGGAGGSQSGGGVGMGGAENGGVAGDGAEDGGAGAGTTTEDGGTGPQGGQDGVASGSGGQAGDHQVAGGAGTAAGGDRNPSGPAAEAGSCGCYVTSSPTSRAASLLTVLGVAGLGLRRRSWEFWRQRKRG
jgi:MYXO-CTERM domain-containing protein